MASSTSLLASSSSLRTTTVRSDSVPSPLTVASSSVPSAPINTNSGWPSSSAAAMAPKTRNVVFDVSAKTPTSSATQTTSPTLRAR